MMKNFATNYSQKEAIPERRQHLINSEGETVQGLHGNQRGRLGSSSL